MNKTVNRVVYTQIREIKPGHCNGCVGKGYGNISLCNALMDDEHCHHTKMIYVKKEEKVMKVIEDIIEDYAKEMFNNELAEKAINEFPIESIDLLIGKSLDSIEDETALKYINDLLATVHVNHKRDFIKNKINDDVTDFISTIEYGGSYDGLDIVRQEAVAMAENDLIDHLIEDNFKELEEIYLKEFYAKLELEFPPAIVSMVRNSIKSSDGSGKMVRSMFEIDVDKFINKIS